MSWDYDYDLMYIEADDICLAGSRNLSPIRSYHPWAGPISSESWLIAEKQRYLDITFVSREVVL